MPNGELTSVLEHVCGLVAGQPDRTATDRELLDRFVSGRDGTAFAALMERHGAMVLAVCRRVLRDAHDAEDACQAAFLVLARKAASIRKRDSVGSWLHGVAVRVAHHLRRSAPRRVPQGPPADMPQPDATTDLTWREVKDALDSELHQLPEHLRAPLVLCCLEGMSRDEAAQQLGVSPGTIKGRLERGRELLRARLTRRDITLSAACFAATLVPDALAAVPAASVVSTLKASLRFRSGESAADLVSPRVAALVEGATRGMFAGASTVWVPLVVGLSLLGAGLVGSQTLSLQQPGNQEQNTPQPDKQAEQPKPGGDKQARTDLTGDPLPAGALVRMGTVRFRASSNWLSFAPGDATLLTAGGELLSAWEVATGKELYRCRCEHGSGSYALAPDGKTLAMGTYTDRPDVVAIYLRDVTTGRAVQEFRGHASWVRSLAFAADGRTLVSGSHDKTVRFWDLTTGKEARRIDEPDLVMAVALSPDGKTLATASRDSTVAKDIIRLRDATTGRELRRFQADVPVFHLHFSPNGQTLVALEPANGGKPTSTIHLCDVLTGKLHQIPGQPEWLYAAAFTPDSKTLATGSNEGIVLWDAATGKQRNRLGGQHIWTSGLTFSRDGKLLASIGDGTIRLWDVPAGKERPVLAEGHQGNVEGLLFLPDGKTLASAGRDRTLRLWEAANGRQVRQHLMPALTTISDCRFDPDGSTLAWRDGKRIAQLDVTTGKPLRSFDFPEIVYYFALAPDGKLLAAYARDRMLRLVDRTTGKVVREFSKKNAEALAAGVVSLDLAFAADGRTLAVGLEDYAGDNALLLMDTTTGERRALLRWPTAPIAFTFSPDGKTLVVALTDNRLVLVEVATGKDRLALRTQEQAAGLRYSPDGKLLTVSTATGPIHVWDLATGKEVRRLEGHRSVGCLAFSMDGRQLASGGYDTTVLTWDMSNLTGKPPAVANLSPKELEALWTDLAGADAGKAYEAIRTLVGAPDQTLPLFRERLRAVPVPDPKHLARLIADLEADQFEVREKATSELGNLGELARPALRQALDGRPTAEVRRRVEELVRKLDQLILTLEQLRSRRAIEVLEQIGTAVARGILERLVREGPDMSLLAVDARAALERLRRQSERKGE